MKSVKTYMNTGVDKIGKDIAEASVLELCLRVKAQARDLAPVAPVGGGRLRGSIDFEIKGAEGFVGSPLEYAIYQEFGTRYMPPQPFLRPAISNVVYGNEAKEVLKKRAEEIAKGNLSKGGERVKFF